MVGRRNNIISAQEHWQPHKAALEVLMGAVKIRSGSVEAGGRVD